MDLSDTEHLLPYYIYSLGRVVSSETNELTQMTCKLWRRPAGWRLQRIIRTAPTRCPCKLPSSLSGNAALLQPPSPMRPQLG